MKLLSKVVWSEGMYLGPHHFQAQSRYFEDSIQFATSSLWFAPYGLAGLELDAEALYNGTIALRHARGIFPDGLAFNMPESDPLPDARAFADLFPPTREGLQVMLAIPSRKLDGANCAVEENGAGGRSALGKDGRMGVRYSAESRMLHDENNGYDERTVRLGRKNFRLLADSEPAGDLLTMPLARVIRDGSGHYIFDPHFVPPVLHIGASPRLMRLAQSLIEILDEKSMALGRSGSSGGTARDFSTREIANFWLLHAVNSGLAPLRHLLASKQRHPEELYLELSRLAGALCTFSLDALAHDLPLYNHDSSSECFSQLEHHIRTHLELVVPTNCITIPLTAAGGYFFDGEAKDTRVMGHSRWVLALSADTGEAEIMTKAPQLVKVCSQSFVRELVKRALPGMTLTHLPVPPTAISARVEAQYFSINRSGPCWDHIQQTRHIGVYVPGEFPNARVDIQVILES